MTGRIIVQYDPSNAIVAGDDPIELLLHVRDRVVSIFYIQDQMQILEKGFNDLMNLAQKADMSFTMLILRNKILTI